MRAGRIITSRRVKWTIAVVICLSAIGMLHKPILISLAHWLDVGESPRKADYVMVLPGGVERRPFVAVAMVRAGLAKGIITDETETDPANDEGLSPTSDDLLRKVLRLRGIRDDQIQVLPGHANSTWKDAIALSDFMQEHPQATVAIVTDCFHTRRSSWVFRRVLGAEARRVFFVSARLDTVDPNSWWTTEEGLITYLSEYLKLFFYVVTDRTVIASSLAIGVAVGLIWSLWRRRRLKQKPTKPSGESESRDSSTIESSDQSIVSIP